MRKLLLSLIIICIISLISIYLLLPAKITFSKIIFIQTKINTANRFVIDESKWGRWFPSDSINNLSVPPGKHTHRYKNYFYSIENKMMNTAEVSISNNKTSLQSFITTLSINEDSVAIEWKSEMPGSSNPIQRIRNYIKAKELQNNMTDILKHLQAFLGKKENVYGHNITQMIVADTLLISTKYTSPVYPSIPAIYSIIKNLREYISKEGAEETNYPMLNIFQDNAIFKTMIAIPISKKIPETNQFVFKKMIPGKILVTEVKGGKYVTGEALKQLNIYLDDNHLSSPAIPFESLITDRSLETDTAKWVTKIYYPIY